MYNAFWRHALFVRGQPFSVKTFDRSRNGCQVIGEGAGNDFRGPSVQALPLPSRVSFSRARFFLCPLLPSACYAGYFSRGGLHLQLRSNVPRKFVFSLFVEIGEVFKSKIGIRVESSSLHVRKNLSGKGN